MQQKSGVSLGCIVTPDSFIPKFKNSQSTNPNKKHASRASNEFTASRGIFYGTNCLRCGFV
jgi:hypothetical protein